MKSCWGGAAHPQTLRLHSHGYASSLAVHINFDISELVIKSCCASPDTLLAFTCLLILTSRSSWVLLFSALNKILWVGPACIHVRTSTHWQLTFASNIKCFKWKLAGGHAPPDALLAFTCLCILTSSSYWFLHFSTLNAILLGGLRPPRPPCLQSHDYGHSLAAHTGVGASVL